MRILAFESSAKAASVAILQDGALLGEYFQNSGQTHSRTLAKMAEDLLANCDLTDADIDAVAVTATDTLLAEGSSARVFTVRRLL